jgi:hypothetical protein
MRERAKVQTVLAISQFIIRRFRVYSCRFDLAVIGPAVCKEVWLSNYPNMSENSPAP